MNEKFRVALSGDFRKGNGVPVFPVFDTVPLVDAPGVEMEYLTAADPLQAHQLEDFDALILLGHRCMAESWAFPGKKTGMTEKMTFV